MRTETDALKKLDEIRSKLYELEDLLISASPYNPGIVDALRTLKEYYKELKTISRELPNNPEVQEAIKEVDKIVNIIAKKFAS